VVAQPGSDPQLLSLPLLDRAVFRDNKFRRLTIAVLSAANTGVVRFQENSVTDCYGGIWLDSLGMGNIVSAESVLGLFSADDFSHIPQAIEVATLYPLAGEMAGSASGERVIAGSSSGRLLSVLPATFQRSGI